ncbi:MAG TPA: AAA family ATPase [Bryobacteraceae bacterium]
MHPLNIGLIIEKKELLDEVQACLHELPVRIQFEQPSINDWATFTETVLRTRPDVLILDVSTLNDNLPATVDKIKDSGLSPMLIALNSMADPESILSALRAGFHEYLFPPLSGNLRRALERRSDERERVREGARKGRVVGFVSAKGGCGATTLACHTSMEIQRLQKFDVLLADMDFESGLVHFLMKTKSTYSIQDAFNNLHRLDMSFWKAIISNGIPRMEIITAPSSASLRQAPRPDQLQQVLRFMRANYDWSIVDLGRNLSYLAMSVLDDIDETCLVTTLDVPALHQAKTIVQTLMNTGYARNRLRLILNRVPQRMEVTPEEIEKMFGIPVFSVITDESQDLYDAYAEGRLVTEGKLAKQLHSFGMKLAGIQEEKKKFRFFG